MGQKAIGPRREFVIKVGIWLSGQWVLRFYALLE